MSFFESRRARRAVGPASFALALIPAIGVGVAFARDQLGANPLEAITHETGEWTLRLLILCLAVTPLRRFAGWSWLAPARRSLGLAAFVYGTLHFAIYAFLDLGLDLEAIVEDVWERPYVTAGFAAYLGMVPLAITSTRAMTRRLGKRWRQLHRAVYAVAVAGVVHFWWLVKADVLEPMIYGAIVGALLASRVPWRALASAPQSD